MCDKKGAEYPSDERLLWRQAEKRLLEDGGTPSSQVFEPRGDMDEGCLSVDDGNMVSAATAHAFFTSLPPSGLGARSESVWGLSVAEVVGLTLSAWADPIDAAPPVPANLSHAVIEFGEMTKSQRKKFAQRLKLLAIQRGQQHPRP